jgi:hypothetical protein
MSSILRFTDARRRGRFLPIIFFLILLIQIFPAFSKAETLSVDKPQSLQDQWYIIKIGGNAVGYLHDELRSEAGGKSYTRTLNYTGEVYGPEGVRRLSVPQLKKPGDKITIQTFIAEASLVSQLTRSVISEETLVLGQENVPTLRVEETLQGIAVKRTAWLDSLGYVVKQEEPGPFGTTEALRRDKSTALAAASGGKLPEEMYKNSIVRTNIRLPRAQSIGRLKLTHKNPSLGWPDLNAPNQKVIAGNEKTLTLEIERPQPASKSLAGDKD